MPFLRPAEEDFYLRIVMKKLIVLIPFILGCVLWQGGEDKTAAHENSELVIKKTLCVIVDFADHTLGEYSGSEINAVTSEEHIQSMLDEMEKHWLWLSHGKEQLQWDLIRIQLDRNLSETAFSSWVEFRDTVANQALENVNIDDYDYDKDQIVDSMWVLAADNGHGYDYLTGGASVNGGKEGVHRGAALFVDTQAGLSVLGRHYGNFNHEAGHNFGLPDLYGSYDTLHYLSLMSDSWALPGNNFSSWEKYKLGWLTPQVIDRDTTGITLSPLEEGLNAVLVPTSFEKEYFIMEYRKKPQSGYGSAPAENFDGLVIYHINEYRLDNGNNNSQPQLIHFDSVGHISEERPRESDFWYPENRQMVLPYRGIPSWSDKPLFEIDNLKRGDGASLTFDIRFNSLTRENLIENGDFEKGTGSWPDFWHGYQWNGKSSFSWAESSGVDNSRCVKITSSEANDARYYQDVENLIPGKTYRFSAMIQTKGVTGVQTPQGGVCLALDGTYIRSPFVQDTGNAWQEISLEFTAEKETARLELRLGYFGDTVTGEVLFDNAGLYSINTP